ncbi:hypothetical protein HK104_007308, partial [Borealophlyctis nickersoniae]
MSPGNLLDALIQRGVPRSRILSLMDPILLNVTPQNENKKMVKMVTYLEMELVEKTDDG